MKQKEYFLAAIIGAFLFGAGVIVGNAGTFGVAYVEPMKSGASELMEDEGLGIGDTLTRYVGANENCPENYSHSGYFKDGTGEKFKKCTRTISRTDILQ